MLSSRIHAHRLIAVQQLHAANLAGGDRFDLQGTIGAHLHDALFPLGDEPLRSGMPGFGKQPREVRLAELVFFSVRADIHGAIISAPYSAVNSGPNGGR